jgi:hypothetical protein
LADVDKEQAMVPWWDWLPNPVCSMRVVRSQRPVSPA